MGVVVRRLRLKLRVFVLLWLCVVCCVMWDEGTTKSATAKFCVWNWIDLREFWGSEGGGGSTCRVTGFWLFVLAAENPVVLCLSVAIIKIVFLRYLWCEATTYDILHRTAEETQYAASRTCTYLPSHVPITVQFFPIRRLSHIIFFFQNHLSFSSFPQFISLSILHKSFFDP